MGEKCSIRSKEVSDGDIAGADKGKIPWFFRQPLLKFYGYSSDVREKRYFFALLNPLRRCADYFHLADLYQQSGAVSAAQPLLNFPPSLFPPQSPLAFWPRRTALNDRRFNDRIGDGSRRTTGGGRSRSTAARKCGSFAKVHWLPGKA